MAHRIAEVVSGGIADQLGILKGDRLLSINGQGIVDFIDYQALCCSEHIRLTVERGEEKHTYAFEKDEYEPLGLSFETPLMSKERDCANQCIFCFVDQLPGDVRTSLQVKDDDWRLSLMMGNFVTMTNVSDRELDRIIERRASPLYISVHATDADLRVRMLGNRRASIIMDQLRRLADAGLTFYAQAVLCPGINDGPALDSTIRDLAGLYPACAALAVVPVGLTEHREGLAKIPPYGAETARKVLDQLDLWREKLLRERGCRFVHGADEFYLLAGRSLPEDEAYEGYPLLENGVGMIRNFETEYEIAWRDAKFSNAPSKVALITGTAFADSLERLVSRFPVPGQSITVFPIENRFFGERVTVAGLLTGGDLLECVASLKDFDRVLVPETMFRAGEEVFLDGTTLHDLKKLNPAVAAVGAGGGELIATLTEE